MSTSAVVMMVIALVVVWGGLVTAIIQIRRRPEVSDAELHESAAMLAEDLEREKQAPIHRDT
jgi:hypothetical protein